MPLTEAQKEILDNLLKEQKSIESSIVETKSKISRIEESLKEFNIELDIDHLSTEDIQNKIKSIEEDLSGLLSEYDRLKKGIE